MRHIEVEVSNVDELLAVQAYGPGALLRWEYAAAELGAWAERGTLPLVAGTTAYDIWDALGVESTWYRTRISNAGGTTFSAYSDAEGPATPSVTSVADVRAMVETTLTDDQLQTLIHREEAWLAGRIGQLVGVRTNIIHPVAADPIWLTRRTDAIAVVVDGTPLAADAYVFSPSIGLLRRAAAMPGYASWGGTVELTWSPTDELEVQAAVIELVRLTTETAGGGALTGETIGTYAYTRAAPTGSAAPSRADIARSVQLPRTPLSMRLRSGMDTVLDRALWPR